jgi:hypothetical protein
LQQLLRKKSFFIGGTIVGGSENVIIGGHPGSASLTKTVILSDATGSVILYGTGSKVTIGAAATPNATLDVRGNITGSGSLGITAGATITGSLVVTGSQTITGSLNVTGSLRMASGSGIVFGPTGSSITSSRSYETGSIFWNTDSGSWWGFFIVACIFELGIVGLLYGSMSEAINRQPAPIASAIRLMRLFILVGWAVYPIGFLMALAGAGEYREIVYNIADVINKVGFGLVALHGIQSLVQTEAARTRHPELYVDAPAPAETVVG